MPVFPCGVVMKAGGRRQFGHRLGAALLQLVQQIDTAGDTMTPFNVTGHPIASTVALSPGAIR